MDVYTQHPKLPATQYPSGTPESQTQLSQLIPQMIKNLHRMIRIRQTKISIGKGTSQDRLHVTDHTGISMETQLVQHPPDPVDTVLRRHSTLDGQLNRLKEDLDSLRAQTILDFADGHPNEQRLARVRVDIRLDAVCPLEVGVEVPSG